MKNLNQILVEAKQTADRRAKVFNQLIKVTEETLIPKFREVLRNFDLASADFRLSEQISEDLNLTTDMSILGEQDSYGLRISTDKFYAFKYEFDGMDWNITEIQEIDLKLNKRGIIYFVIRLLERIEKIVNKYNGQVLEAEGLIQKIEQL